MNELPMSIGQILQGADVALMARRNALRQRHGHGVEDIECLLLQMIRDLAMHIQFLNSLHAPSEEFKA